MPFLYGMDFYPLNSWGALMLFCVACSAMDAHPRYRYSI